MGAVPHPAGTTFRVWAPHAETVAVVGDFNGWNAGQNPLTLENNGYWAADVAGAEPGQQYKYEIRNGGTFQRNDPYAREVTNSAGNSVIHNPHFDWQDDGFQMPAWHELVIYELHVGTFNAPKENAPGTFYDVIEKLPYLRDLGINCIELLPATEFPGSRSWGYNPTNPFALESDYGGPIGFKTLVRAAHRHGIAVVLDAVYNHFGPGDLDLWQFDGWKESDERGGIYFYNDWRAETPWGHNRPDYGRPEVRQYIRDNALMWLEEYRCDGLRLDSIAHIRSVNGTDDPATALPDGWSLMRWVNAEIQARQPWKIIIAEDLQSNPAITKPVAEGGQGFAAQWDAGFVGTVREAITTPRDADRDLPAVAAAVAHTYNGQALQRVIYTESHDKVANGQHRVPEEIMPGAADAWYPKKRAILGAALVFTSPGIPMLFQGQEFLEDGSFVDTEPLQWGRAEQFGGLVQLYRDLIALRRNRRGTTRGLGGQHTRVFHVNNTDKVLAFVRWAEAEDGPGDATVILANFADRAYDSYTIGLPAGGDWPCRFNSDWRGYDDSFGDFDSLGMMAQGEPRDGYAWSGSTALAPYGVVVFSR